MWVLLLFGRKVLLIRERERGVSSVFEQNTHDRQQKVIDKKMGKKEAREKKKKKQKKKKRERASTKPDRSSPSFNSFPTHHLVYE